MAWRCVTYMAVVVLLASTTLQAQDQQIPLRLLFLSRSGDDAREQAFVEFFRHEFASVNVKKRTEFNGADATNVDVVVLDWSQQERQSTREESPIGPLETWNTPIVLLGSAGHMIAGPWEVIGGFG